MLQVIIDTFLHLDKNLALFTSQYGGLVYGLLFLIIFMETGFVVTPFLPGDSLLFAAGAIAATGSLNIVPLYVLLLVAAILGDTVNYWIGHFTRDKIFDSKTGLFKESRFIKKSYLIKAHNFYEKYGGQAITLARFVPIVRTFAPFVAGIVRMDYKQFILYNVLGGFLWVSGFTFAGYFFGNLPIVKENFHYAVVGIIIVSIIPIAYEFVKAKLEKSK